MSQRHVLRQVRQHLGLHLLAAQPGDRHVELPRDGAHQHLLVERAHRRAGSFRVGRPARAASPARCRARPARSRPRPRGARRSWDAPWRDSSAADGSASRARQTRAETNPVGRVVPCAAVSELPGIDRERVARFVLEHVPGATPPVEFELISGGRSNLTYRVRAGERVFALRRPPLGHVIADRARHGARVPRARGARRHRRAGAAPDRALRGRGRERRALLRDGVPRRRRAARTACPRASCADAEDGAAHQPGARRHARRAARRRLPRRRPRRTSAAPTATSSARCARWSKQWERNRTAPLPEIDELLARLARALPTSPPRRRSSTATTGSATWRSTGSDPGRVVAIFDWEMATLGDPLADLGYTLIYWTEAGERAGRRRGGHRRHGAARASSRAPSWSRRTRKAQRPRRRARSTSTRCSRSPSSR